MRKAASLFLLVAVLAGCGSASNRAANAPVPPPEVIVVQTAGVAAAARNVTGPIPVKYAVRVSNPAKESIQLKRIDAQSVGAGAYTLRSTSRPFDVAIPPDAHRDVEFWANAVVDQSTIIGANGPVSLRLILYFDSPKGTFEHIVIQQVNERLTGEPH